MKMTKTLLSVPTQALSRLKALAERRQTTVSLLLREAVEKTYGIDAGAVRNPDWSEDPLVKFFGTLDRPAGGGPSDLAENHDNYIYGWDKKKGRRK